MLHCRFHQSFHLIVATRIILVATIVEGYCGGCSNQLTTNSKLTYSTISFGGKDAMHVQSRNCFPYGSVIIYACSDNITNQFALGSINPYRKCTAMGWLNIYNKIENYAPNCVPRKPHCRFPDINKGTFIVIDYQNYTDRLEINYSENTIATYKCQDNKAQLTTGTEIARITCKKNGSAYDWNGSAPNCVMNRYSSTSTKDITTATTSYVITERPTRNLSVGDENQKLWYYILVGCCCAMALVLVAMIYIYRKRLRLAFSKDSTGNTSSANIDSNKSLISEGKPKGANLPSQSSQYSDDGLYQNIIPLKVNSEPIYIEVETSKLASANDGALKKAVQSPRYNYDSKEVSNTQKERIEEDQLHTIYAEIHHDLPSSLEVSKN